MIVRLCLWVKSPTLTLRCLALYSFIRPFVLFWIFLFWKWNVERLTRINMWKETSHQTGAGTHRSVQGDGSSVLMHSYLSVSQGAASGCHGLHQKSKNTPLTSLSRATLQRWGCWCFWWTFGTWVGGEGGGARVYLGLFISGLIRRL